MEQPTKRSARPGAKMFVVALLAGLAVLLLLFPGSGIDRQPPECYAVLGYVVPCGGGLAMIAAASVAVVVGLVLSLKARRRMPG
ncbi:MAG: hypothetical protein WEG56_13190 [Chloroflexota bacterium]